MPLYRGAQAELRRVHRNARWVVAGLHLDGRFYGSGRVRTPASTRLRQSGNVWVEPLPDYIAPEGAAVRVGMGLAFRLAADARTVAANELPIEQPAIRIEP